MMSIVNMTLIRICTLTSSAFAVRRVGSSQLLIQENIHVEASYLIGTTCDLIHSNLNVQ